jgi:hypothetical protein
MSVQKQRNKPLMMKGFVTVLRANSGKVNEDLAWEESWLNFLIPL